MLGPLPSDLTIRGLTFRVELVPMTDDAELVEPAQLIRVNRALGREAQWLAFVHELLEAISDPNNDLLPDHTKLSVLAEHLFTALRSSGLLDGGAEK